MQPTDSADDHRVTLQFPATSGMSNVVTVFSEGVGQRFGLADRDAERLAMAVDEAVALLIDPAQSSSGDFASPATNSEAPVALAAPPPPASPQPPSLIQVTFLSSVSGVQADVIRQGFCFASQDEAFAAHSILSSRLGDSITSVAGPTSDGGCTLFIAR